MATDWIHSIKRQRLIICRGKKIKIQLSLLHKRLAENQMTQNENEEMRKLPWAEMLTSGRENAKHENSTQDKDGCFVFMKSTSVIAKSIVMCISWGCHYGKPFILIISFNLHIQTKFHRHHYCHEAFRRRRNWPIFFVEEETGPSFAKTSQGFKLRSIWPHIGEGKIMTP